MKAIEAAFNKAIKRKLKRLWPTGVMWHRVENSAALGTFDSFLGVKGVGTGWIELKVGGPNAKPAMRPGQPGFGIQCREAGVPAHVLMADQVGGVKLIKGWTTGPDWRDLLVMRAEWLDDEAVRRVFLACLGH